MEQAIADYIYYKIGHNYSREWEYEVVTSLSKGFQAVYTTRQAELEIDNGGFNQYFWNSSEQFATEAIDGFREIGAPKAATIMEREIAIAVDEFPEMKKYREEGTLEAFSGSCEHTKLNDLDLEFFDLYHDEDLSALRIRYIRTHRELFVGE